MLFSNLGNCKPDDVSWSSDFRIPVYALDPDEDDLTFNYIFPKGIQLYSGQHEYRVPSPTGSFGKLQIVVQVQDHSLIDEQVIEIPAKTYIPI